MAATPADEAASAAASWGLEKLLAFHGIDAGRFWAAVSAEAPRLHLVTIVFSHYNDKARWMLKAAGETFTEDSYLSMFHMPAVWRLQRAFKQTGRKDVTSSPLSTPALAIYDAAGSPMLLLQDSTLISRFAVARALRKGVPCPLYSPAVAASPAAASAACDAAEAHRLLEDPAVLALEKRFHDRLGTAARVVAYYHLLPRFAAFAQLDWNNAPWYVALPHILLYPLLFLMLYAAFGLSRRGYERALAKVTAEFDAAEALLAAPAPDGTGGPGRLYLTGNTFTAADVTFAALGSILVGIGEADGYGAWLPPAEALGAEGARLTKALASRPAGQLIRRMYANHR